MEIPIGLNVPGQAYVDPLGQALINTTTTSLGVGPRPGSFLKDEICSSGNMITGVYNWEEHSVLIIVCNGNVYKLTYDKDSFLKTEDDYELKLQSNTGSLLLEAVDVLTDVTSDIIVGTNRVIFADYGDFLYMAFGGKIIELSPSTDVVTNSGTSYTCIKNNVDIEPGVTTGWETYWTATGTGTQAWVAGARYGSGVSEYLEDADAPTNVSFIAITNKTMVALEDGTQTIWFSETGAPWSWDSDWFQAEYLPDNAVCLRMFNGDLIVGGQRSIQTFTFDGVTPWSASSYGGISSGVMSPYTLVDNMNGSLFYIDSNRRFVYLDGRTAKVVLESVDTFLNTLSYVDDAVADYIVVEGIGYYILHFKKEDKTLAINTDNKTWSVWNSTDSSGYESRWYINCLTYIPIRDLTVGGTVDGDLVVINSKTKTDCSDVITSTIRTPRIQTPERIFVKDLVVGLTKSVKTTDAVINSSVSVRWRDDGKDWSGYLTKSVDGTETDQVLHFRRVGSYRNTRQYEFDCSNLYPYSIRKVDQL